MSVRKIDLKTEGPEEEPVFYIPGRYDITILTRYSGRGVGARVHDPRRMLCGRDLRGLADALMRAADRVDELNRQDRKKPIISFTCETIPIIARPATTALNKKLHAF